MAPSDPRDDSVLRAQEAAGAAGAGGGRAGERTRRRAAAALLLALAAAASWGAAHRIADQVERRTAEGAAAVLTGRDMDWVRVEADGLRLSLGGTAPDEAARFRARALAGTVVDARRIDDRIVLRPPAAVPPPAFRVELLRDDQGVSVIGLAPAATDRAALMARAGQIAGGKPVTDLLEQADRPAPADWDAALEFGLTAAARTPRGKIAIADGRVEVTAMADSAADQARLRAALIRARPESVALSTDISAPRPVIAPFALRLVRDQAGTRVERCAADSEAARLRILAAARAAGATGAPDCAVGLGAPGPGWADAAVAAIAALARLDRGTVDLVDRRIVLEAPDGAPDARLSGVAATLRQALPPGFAVTATPAEPMNPVMAPPARFTAAVTPEGLRLEGRITDERMGQAVESFARARFGAVDSALTVDGDTPPGWTVRVMATLEAMAELAQGSATVTPDLIRLGGVSGHGTAAADAARRLGARLGAGVRYEMAIAHDPRLDPARASSEGEACVAALNETLRQSGIGFAPDGAAIAGDAAPVLARLAATMKDCAVFRIGIGGRGTDAPDDALSVAQARALLDAMRAAGIATDNLTAQGPGETGPVARDDESGGEDEPAVAFRLLSPVPVIPALEPGQPIRGVTEAVEPDPATSITAPRDHAAQGSGDEPTPADATAGPAPGAPMVDRLPGPPPDLAPSSPPAEAGPAPDGPADLGAGGPSTVPFSGPR